jgi:hypothetical protein
LPRAYILTARAFNLASDVFISRVRGRCAISACVFRLTLRLVEIVYKDRLVHENDVRLNDGASSGQVDRITHVMVP